MYFTRLRFFIWNLIAICYNKRRKRSWATNSTPM